MGMYYICKYLHANVTAIYILESSSKYASTNLAVACLSLIHDGEPSARSPALIS
jgi:hypothetical protein